MIFSRRAVVLRAAWLLTAVTIGSSGLAHAGPDLLGDPLNFSGATLHLRTFATMPGNFNDIISMTTRPGDTRLYVTAQEGTIFTVSDNGNGTTSVSPWFNVKSAIDQATDRFLFGDEGHRGLQSVAFHPGFANAASPGYGKLYTTLMETHPESEVGHNYLGNSSSGDPNNYGESVLVEWTYNHTTQQVDSSSYRELFRIKLPVQDHMIKQAKFNPYAEPGDEDYGLLYLTHGDSSSQWSAEDRPLLLDNVFGKMLRIDPLESGGDPYSVPASNPFFGVGGALGEIYAYGMRNPHNFSFNPDDEGNVHILVGDIGRSNIEEVNLVVKGGNYGWTKREGTFVHEQTTINVREVDKDNPPANADAGYILGVRDLPPDEATDGMDTLGNRYIYPVAQWDHNDDDVWVGQDYTATAIASSFVIRNGSDPALQNQFIHNNFAFNHGDVYQNDFGDILNAVTQLDPNDSTRNEPSELTQAETFRLHLSFDDDNDPTTAPELSDDFNALLDQFFARNDARFGEGLLGEMYISSKWTGKIYLVTNTIPYDADFDDDGDVDGDDYLVWQRNTGVTVGYGSDGDANHNGLVDKLDLGIWEDQYGTQPPPLTSASTAVPESAAATLFALAALAMVTRRIRHQD